MTIPFLDALLPPSTTKIAPHSAGNGPPGAFETLLAGLNTSVASLPGDLPAAAPGAALPPTGKTLPGGLGPVAISPIAIEPVADGQFADGQIADGQIADGQVADGRSAGIAFDRLSDDPGDDPVRSEADENVPSAPVTALAAIVLAPVATLASPAATLPHVLPASPVAAAGAIAPSPAQQNSAEPASTERPTLALARRIAASEPSAPQAGLASPAATPASEMRPSAAQATPPATEAPKPAQPPVPGLTILATGAQPSLPGATPPPLRSGHEGKPTQISLASSLAIAPEAASVAIFAAPAAFVAAPVTVTTGIGAPDAATSPVQPAVSPIALPDHRALVEALVRARTERDPGVSVALETREFGAVALRFEALQSATGERGLRVAFSSGDPGFERAVASAAAAQAALADQSGRNPANRADPALPRSGDAAGNPYSDASGGRASSSDPQSQHRPGSAESWREPRSRQSADLRARGEDHGPASYSAAPHADRRRGSIFA